MMRQRCYQADVAGAVDPLGQFQKVGLASPILVREAIKSAVDASDFTRTARSKANSVIVCTCDKLSPNDSSAQEFTRAPQLRRADH